MTGTEDPQGLRVLYIIDSLAASGGAERSLAAIAPAYRDVGIHLDVAYLHDREGLDAELQNAGANLVPLAGRGGRAGWIGRARSVIRQRRPDLVHTTLFEADITGRVAAKLARTPVVSTLASESYGPAHYGDPRISSAKLRAAQTIDAMTARFAVRLHAVSTTVADQMSARLRYPRDRIDVIPRGRNPERLGERTEERRRQVRRSLGMKDGTTLVVGIGRHEFDKGLDVLVRAMPAVEQAIPNARLVIAGREGSQTEELKKLARSGGIGSHVTLLGAREDVPELLCGADVFVLPSRREGFPGAVLEAMALETPVVAADLPQVREATDASGALLTTPSSVEALAAAIVDAVNNRAASRARVEAARDRFLRQFTIEAIAPQMLAFYQRALADSAVLTDTEQS